MEFYIVIKQLLFKEYFFFWYIPYVCWVIPATFRVFFGDGLLFGQEVKFENSILDYKA